MCKHEQIVSVEAYWRESRSVFVFFHRLFVEWAVHSDVIKTVLTIGTPMKIFNLALAKWILLMATASMLSGCIGLAMLDAQGVMVAASVEEERLANVFVGGTTNKQELIAQLGLPLHELDDGKVLIFGCCQRS